MNMLGRIQGYCICFNACATIQQRNSCALGISVSFGLVLAVVGRSRKPRVQPTTLKEGWPSWRNFETIGTAAFNAVLCLSLAARIPAPFSWGRAIVDLPPLFIQPNEAGSSISGSALAEGDS